MRLKSYTVRARIGGEWRDMGDVAACNMGDAWQAAMALKFVTKVERPQARKTWATYRLRDGRGISVRVQLRENIDQKYLDL